METLFIIKVGGNVLDDESALSNFLSDYASITGKKILVHGGGKIATTVSKKMGVVSKMIEGRRVTSADDLEVVTMVYGGLINKQVVAKLQAFQCNAIGVSGADFNLIPAKRRPIKEIDYGFVGDVSINDIPKFHWKLLLEGGMCPVVAPITHDNNGQLLNTNADTIATSLALALSKQYVVRLLYCFEKPGVLLDAEDERTLVSELNKELFDQLKQENKVHSGMIPKLDNAFAAIEGGVQHVHVVSAAAIANISKERESLGTKIGL